MRIIFLSGLSGSGKTVALHMLEDLGYTSLDNFPIRLLRDYVAQEVNRDAKNRRIAIGMDARAGQDDLQTLPALVGELRDAGIECEVVFLTSDDDTLVRRYSETRRRHPLAQDEGSLSDAIREERAVLSNVAEHADLTIDTTHLNVHDLREIIRQRLRLDGAGELSLMFMSFGYKNGVPRDADFVFDLRCLPNPHWENALRPLTGRDAAVVLYLQERDSVAAMREDIIGFLDKWIPCFQGADRSYLTVALGCTGGRHRSVYMAEQLAAHFSRKYPKVLVRHSSLAEVIDARQLNLALGKND
ncbi:MAG TPA: RNase adapter RapZ [Gammaproteobacteria bacterium]